MTIEDLRDTAGEKRYDVNVLSGTAEDEKIQIVAKDVEISCEAQTAFCCDDLELRGSILGIIGPNGAGKSTFIKSILKLLEPKSGSLKVYYHSRGCREILEPSRDMAYCPEAGAVFNDISVEDYLAFWCRLRHGSARYLKGDGRVYLDALDIWPLMKKRGVNLSKGEKQRVQTGAGFLLQPRLFLFDEPFDGLDVQRTHDLLTLINSRLGHTKFIVSSHRMDVIEGLADTLMVLNRGTVVVAGSIPKVCTHLGGDTIVITVGAGTVDEVRILLAKVLIGGIVKERGKDLVVTGAKTSQSISSNGVDAYLRDVLASSGFHGDVSTRVPTLSDAMTLYLRQLS